MLFTLCKQMIQKRQIEGMQEKLDAFLAADRLTVTEYETLLAMMKPTDVPAEG